MKKEAIISIAAGVDQICLIEKAKEMGYAVIAVDRDPQAPGLSLSDEKIITSTYDANKVIQGLENIKSKYNIRGVTTKSSGIPVITTAIVAAELGLPGIAPETARIVTDKSSLMEKCYELGIPAPAHTSISALEELDLTRMGYPLILKPSLGLVGKKGIFLVQEEKELREKFILSKLASYNGIIDVEEYIKGQDTTHIALIHDGELYPVILIDEITKVGQDGDFVGMGFRIPSRYGGSRVQRVIEKVVDKFVRKLSTRHGFVANAFRVNQNGEVRLIESHFDLCGDFVIDKLIPASTSFDLIKEVITVFVGKKPNVDRIIPKPATIFFFYENDLSQNRDRKIEQLKAIDDVLELNIFDKMQSNARVGFILLKSDTTHSINSVNQILRGN